MIAQRLLDISETARTRMNIEIVGLVDSVHKRSRNTCLEFHRGFRYVICCAYEIVIVDIAATIVIDSFRCRICDRDGQPFTTILYYAIDGCIRRSHLVKFYCCVIGERTDCIMHNDCCWEKIDFYAKFGLGRVLDDWKDTILFPIIDKDVGDDKVDVIFDGLIRCAVEEQFRRDGRSNQDIDGGASSSSGYQALLDGSVIDIKIDSPAVVPSGSSTDLAADDIIVEPVPDFPKSSCVLDEKNDIKQEQVVVINYMMFLFDGWLDDLGQSSHVTAEEYKKAVETLTKSRAYYQGSCL